MKEGFRQTMAWVHTWTGLVGGWLLCAIFLTGTLSVFREPITHWMSAQPSVGAAQGAQVAPVDPLPSTALGRAVAYLEQNAPQARFWRIHLPEHPGQALMLVWRSGGNASGQQKAALDPVTGDVLPQPWGRETEGGRHFMLFHYMLHGGTTGFWIVGAVSMFALAALVSGVIVHRRIFADFFTFRPGKGQRSWLDAHNATAVLTLPFLFMIVYTGVAFFYTSYMPWPLRAAYGEERAHAVYQKELVNANTPAARPRSGQAAALGDIQPMVLEAQRLAGVPARMVFVEHPGDAHASVRVYGKNPGEEKPLAHGTTLLNPPSIVSFDGVSGTQLTAQLPRPDDAPTGDEAHQVVKALHVVTYGGWPMKWLYFLSGLLGTAMIATGTVLFTVKRRRKSEMEFGGVTANFYRFVEAMNVACMAGTCLASIGYLYANRLIPAGLTGRDVWEIRAFLLILGASLLHALWQVPTKAWVQQFALAGVLGVALPLLNIATTGEHLGRYAARKDWLGFGVELTAVVLGSVLLYAAYRVQRNGKRWP